MSRKSTRRHHVVININRTLDNFSRITIRKYPRGPGGIRRFNPTFRSPSENFSPTSIRQLATSI